MTTHHPNYHPSLDNGYNFTWSEPKCWQAESWNQWDYDDVQTQCNDNPFIMWSRAEACCSDGLSVCKPYASQLCLNADAYNPTATAYSGCTFEMSATSADDAFKSSFSCPAGCFSKCPGDGSCDEELATWYECHCNEIATTEAACSAIDREFGLVLSSLRHSHACSRPPFAPLSVFRSVSLHPSTSMPHTIRTTNQHAPDNGYSFIWSETMCWQADSWGLVDDVCSWTDQYQACWKAGFAKSCCSDGQSICEGYEDYVSPTCGPSSELLAAAQLWCSDPISAEAQYGHISTWDVSSENSLAGLFKGCESFNENISGWDGAYDEF